MKALIDTNVILDALMSREPWAASAQSLLRAAAMERFKCYITASQTTDIFYILCHQGADAISAKNIIKKLIVSVKVSDITSTDVQNALSSEMIDYEDAILAYAAKRQKADYIVSRNYKDFERSPVPVLSPEELLKELF